VAAKVPEMLTGDGELSFSGYAGGVGYQIPVKATAKKLIPPGYRGALTLPPDTARALFKASFATLRLDDGKSCRVVVLGHTEGSRTAYFQTIA
jgi:hypothetical protein